MNQRRTRVLACECKGRTYFGHNERLRVNGGTRTRVLHQIVRTATQMLLVSSGLAANQNAPFGYSLFLAPDRLRQVCLGSARGAHHQDL
jgi:hypothetical protein